MLEALQILDGMERIQMARLLHHYTQIDWHDGGNFQAMQDDQWALDNINIERVWEFTSNAEGLPQRFIHTAKRSDSSR